MSEDIIPPEAKPKGSGLTTSDDIDTRMGYKAVDRDPSTSGRPKVKVSKHRNRQREVKL